MGKGEEKGTKNIKTALKYQKVCENVVYIPKKHYLCT
jgi:hypothetical protein